MDKYQAQQTYWAGFGLKAYNELTVPEEERDKYPYLTYQLVEGTIDGPVTASASLYYKGTSWAPVLQKAEAMSPEINKQIKITGGYMKVRRPAAHFAQQASDPDPMVRRILLTVEIEFLTGR